MGRPWGEVDGEDHPHKEITQAIIGEAIEIQKGLPRGRGGQGGMEVGLLLNFRQWPFKDGGIKRVIHTRA